MEDVMFFNACNEKEDIFSNAELPRGPCSRLAKASGALKMRMMKRVAAKKGGAKKWAVPKRRN
jgi:hypothetical protein